MFQRSEGVVFRVFPFRDSSHVLKIFTRDYGIKSFIVRSSSKSRNNKLAKIQPLNILNIEWKAKGDSELVYARNIEIAEPYKDIPLNIEKSSILLFLSEILYKTIKEEFENQDLYDYIKNALIYLDHCQEYSNFHLCFLLKMSKYYGYMPFLDQKNLNNFFDVQDGNLQFNEPRHKYYFSEDNTALLKQFSGMNFDESERVKLSREKRNLFLKDIINYYRYHIDGMEEIKGHEVLQEVFS